MKNYLKNGGVIFFVDAISKSEYIDKIVKQTYVDDIRFDELFPELPHIKYISDQSFEIADDESVIYISYIYKKCNW